jgi:hypothetical protein
LNLLVDLIMSRVTTGALAAYESMPAVRFDLGAADADVRVNEWRTESKADGDAYGSIVKL